MKLRILICLIYCCGAVVSPAQHNLTDNDFVTYVADPKIEKVKFYWKDKAGHVISSFRALNDYVQKNGDELIFAMNGGMYNHDHSPQGLYIENGNMMAPLDTVINGYGNFYMQPNGVFYLDSSNQAFVKTTTEFISQHVNYATQSGPMLLINGSVHPTFKINSSNLNIRNGVGVLSDGRILFAMSKKEITLYDFASYFRNKGCKNALYLDGFVSRVYYPKKEWTHEDGKFGVLIGITR